MRYPDEHPRTIAASIERHIFLFKETVLPWQTLSGLAWLLCGVFCCEGSVRIFSDWSFVAVVVAVTIARFSGMCWNRLIDWRIDARNPRTARRALPSGRLAPQELALYALLTLALFLSTCFLFPPIGRFIGIGVAIAIVFYSFAKRFTSGCHFILGVIHGCLPLAGAIWQSGTINLPSILLSVAAFSAVSGTDILYAMQDELFDRRFRLFSIPARYGAGSALQTAAVLHALACIAITFAIIQVGISPAFIIAWCVCMVVVLKIWHSVWMDHAVAFSKAFPILLVGFSLSTLFTLSLDRAWKLLS